MRVTFKDYGDGAGPYRSADDEPAHESSIRSAFRRCPVCGVIFSVDGHKHIWIDERGWHEEVIRGPEMRTVGNA